MGSANVWRRAHGAGGSLLTRTGQSVERSPRSDGHCRLSICLYAAENEDLALNLNRRLSWCGTTIDWVDCCARHNQSRRLGTLCDSLSLAVSAFPGHRLDVSRRLWTGRHPDATGCGTGRTRHRPTDRRLHTNVDTCQLVAGSARHVREALFLRRHCAWSAFSLQQCSGGILHVAAARATSAFGFSSLFAAVVFLDGPE